MLDANISDNNLERYRRIRASFVAKGTSLAAWCNAHGVKHQNAHKALMGTWTGPKATALVTEILRTVGVDE